MHRTDATEAIQEVKDGKAGFFCMVKSTKNCMDWEKRINELDEQQAVLVRQLAVVRNIRKSQIIPEFYYAGQEDFLLQHGEWFAVQPWSYSGFEGPPKCCYGHSAFLCSLYPQLEYVEGVALFKECPLMFEHAWVTNAQNELIDGTWLNVGRAYLGVRFPLKMITTSLKKSCSVLNNCKDKFALYRKPWTKMNR